MSVSFGDATSCHYNCPDSNCSLTGHSDDHDDCQLHRYGTFRDRNLFSDNFDGHTFHDHHFDIDWLCDHCQLYDSPLDDSSHDFFRCALRYDHRDCSPYFSDTDLTTFSELLPVSLHSQHLTVTTRTTAVQLGHRWPKNSVVQIHLQLATSSSSERYHQSLRSVVEFDSMVVGDMWNER